MLVTFAALLLFIGLISIGIRVDGQNLNEERENRIEEIIESISASGLAGSDNPLLPDDLARYSEKPLNINTASAEELERLSLMGYTQIQQLLSYRAKYGPLLSPYELNAIEGFTPEITENLLPFISFEQPPDSGRTQKPRLMQKMIVRAKSSFPFPRGFSSVSETKPAVYTGPPFGLYSRYNMEIPGRLEAGVIADHDAGEAFFKESNPYGFDHYSGFISWQGQSLLRQVTLGDFYLMFGQGVNYWSGSGPGKSDNLIHLMRTGQGIRPYASADENRFFRGAAAVLGMGALKLTLFYSGKKRDANLVVDNETGETQFTSLKTDGYHRTTSETEDEKSVSEMNAGVYGELRFERFRIGALYSRQHFGLKMMRGTQAYKANSFEGKENGNTGIDWQAGFRKVQLFGEAGMSGNGKYGILQGMEWYAHQRINLSFLYRYFDPGFHAFRGNPVTEGTEGRNERGIYTGVEIFPARKVKLSGYADFYRFPQLTYSTLQPENGRDFLVRADIAFSERLNLYTRCKFETKPQKVTNIDNPADFNEILNKFRLHAEWKVTGRVLLKNRIEYAHYAFSNLKENGWLIYQEAVFMPSRKVDFRFRHVWFNTDGYNSRIYAYESDLLYYFSIPEFHGTGQRIYLNLKWRPAERITACFKAGYTLHRGANSWGSGYDETKGNSRTEIRGEICMRF